MAGLLGEISNVCQCSVAEGMDPAKDLGRNKHLVNLVNEVYRLARICDNWQICQETFRILTEGTADEMEQHIAKNDTRSKAAKAGRQVRFAIVAFFVVTVFCPCDSLRKRRGPTV